MKVLFSPPDITEEEIAEVIDTLKSGWITTGPKTKKFESIIAEYCHTKSSLLKFSDRKLGDEPSYYGNRSRR